MRVKRGRLRTLKRKRLLAQTKGFRWGRKNKTRLAKTAVLKAGVHAYTDRKRKKRDRRRLWNININAGARANGLTYSKLIDRLNKEKIVIDRKVLADLAANEPAAFSALVAKVNK
ncbi:MAG: 50S ribosomal protein L20 [Patescibacteria group bacterium]